jgi:hypothetical protein
MTTRHWCGLGVLAAAVLTAPLGAAAQVPEPFPTHRRADGYTYNLEYRSAKPIRGHEGFYGIGPRQRYCSYIRTPNRECDRRGCRVTSWTLQQYCN